MAGPTFSRKSALSLTVVNSNSSSWMTVAYGDYLYMAASTDGIRVFDASTPSAPVQLDNVRLKAPYERGSHTAANGTTLTDSTKSWATDEYNNYICENLTQGWSMAVSSNTATTLTGSRIGGGSTSWETGDTYRMTRTLSTGVTDIYVNGSTDTLYVTARSINFDDPEPGYVAAYDVTNPAAPVFIDGFRSQSFPATVPPTDLSPPPTGDTFDQDWWPQGITMNPGDDDHVFVACQTYGLDVLDVSDPLNITRAASWTISDLKAAFTDWATDRLYWEASRIVFNDGWVYLANHGNGVMAIDVSTPTSPTNAQWYPAPIVNNFGTPTTLRTRNVVVQGEWLYECPNDADLASPERGLIVRNIASPDSTAPLNYAHTPIGVADNDTPWAGHGDEPILGLTVLDRYAYLANGEKGTAVFDIGDPSTPVYLGLQGTDTPDNTNLSQTNVVRQANGAVYAYYSDYKQLDSPGQKQNLYTDEVIGGQAMPDYIGYHAPTGTGGGTNTITSASGAQSTDSAEANGTRLYTVVAGKKITGGGLYGSADAAGRGAKIVLYAASSGKPSGSPIFELDVPVDDSVAAWEALQDFDLSAYVGQTLTVSIQRGVAAGSLTIYRHTSFGGVVSSVTADPNEAAPDPWTESTTANTDLAFWLAVESSSRRRGGGGKGTRVYNTLPPQPEEKKKAKPKAKAKPVPKGLSKASLKSRGFIK